MKSIYLDHNSTTQMDAEVLAELASLQAAVWGNSSSIHQFGQKARAVMASARRRVAQFFGVRHREIVFTSGGTEALNLLVRGFIEQHQPRRIISSALEHSAVLAPLEAWQGEGRELELLNPGREGAVTSLQLAGALKKGADLIVLMAVNNETGVKTDLFSIAALAREANIPLIVDGTAWVGKEEIVLPLGVLGFACSAHKFHGPPGVGIAIIRSGLKVRAQILGGAQELGLRAGTENVPAVGALAKALEQISSQLPVATEEMAKKRDLFEQILITRCKAEGVEVTINGSGPRICNTSNLCFHRLDGEGLLMALDLKGVAASHGSACHSGALEPSRVLQAMGLSLEEAGSSLRFSLGSTTTEADIVEACDRIMSVVCSAAHSINHNQSTGAKKRGFFDNQVEVV